MKGTKLWRTFQEGARNYSRNGWLTVTTVVVMTLSLFIVTLTMIIGITSSMVLDNLKNKINISVSFQDDVSEDDILTIKQTLEKYKEVASVEYISKEKALATFISLGAGNPVINESLEAIGENPLPASLNIKAHTPEQYPMIASALNQASFKDAISRVNYEKNKIAIERLDTINKLTRKFGLILAIIFISIAFLITFNTIRINMHARRNEFEIMRLVGASNTYVRMPLVFEGIFYGLTAAIATLGILFVTIHVFSPMLKGFSVDGTLFDYYMSHFFTIAGVVIVFSVLIGGFGGAVAVKKYLKV